jgi:tetratricopeptide (TPR) repeat protein
MYPQSLADYNRLVAFGPEDEDAHRRRGELFMDMKEYSKAITDFTTAINLDKANAGSVYTLRAKAYQAMGKPDLAAKDLKSAKEFNERF